MILPIRLSLCAGLVFFFFSFPVFGEEIQKNTTWSGVVEIKETVSIAKGITLTIEPGTRIKFKHYRGYKDPQRRLQLIINGNIVANGRKNAPIYFTSDAANPQNGDWSMVRIKDPTGPSEFKFCVFEFAQQGLNVWNAEINIKNCVFRWNNWEGIYFESYCRARMSHCLIYENGYNGLAAEQFNLITMDYCEVFRNGTCGIHSDASEIEILQSWVHDNLALGLSVDDNAKIKAQGVKIYNNSAKGIGFGQGNNVVEVGNIEIYGNKGGDDIGSAVRIPSSYSIPAEIELFFKPEMKDALGYIPGDQFKDRYRYVYPDDETRIVVKKLGQGLGLTWSVAWDGENLWTATLTGKLYKISPKNGEVLASYDAPGPQSWGMAFDGSHLWIVDFAEKRISKVDRESGRELLSFPTPDPKAGCKGVTWDGKYLCVMGWASSKIYRMDRDGKLINTIDLGSGGGGGIAWDGDNFWVSGGKIIKYNAEGKALGYIYPASEGTWDLEWDGRNLWACQRTNENWKDAKLFALEIREVKGF